MGNRPSNGVSPRFYLPAPQLEPYANGTLAVLTESSRILKKEQAFENEWARE